MEDTTSSHPRGTSTWTQCYGNAMCMVEGQSRIKDGGRTNPGNTTPCPMGLRKSQEFDIFSFMVLIVANSCVLWSPMVPREWMFQRAILVFDLAYKKFNVLVLNAFYFYFCDSLNDTHKTVWDTSPHLPHRAISKAIAQ